MKLDTEHYIEHYDGTVTGRDGKTYMVPRMDDRSRVRLYRGGGISFDTMPASDKLGINAEFIRRGIRPPYVP